MLMSGSLTRDEFVRLLRRLPNLAPISNVQDSTLIAIIIELSLCLAICVSLSICASLSVAVHLSRYLTDSCYFSLSAVYAHRLTACVQGDAQKLISHVSDAPQLDIEDFVAFAKSDQRRAKSPGGRTKSPGRLVLHML